MLRSVGESVIGNGLGDSEPSLVDLVPVKYCPELTFHVRDISVGPHKVGSSTSQLYLPAWLDELSYEEDRGLSDYITRGVTEGFSYCRSIKRDFIL